MSPTTPALLNTLRLVPLDRLSKAVTALQDRSYSVAVSSITEHAISATVSRDAAHRYSVLLRQSGATCSCKDAAFRTTRCKHAALVALHCLRTPVEQIQQHRWHVGDRVDCNGQRGKIVCVSPGDQLVISVAFDTGRIRPLTADELAVLTPVAVQKLA